MKKRLLFMTISLASTMIANALTGPTYTILSTDPPEASINYPSSLAYWDTPDETTTCIDVPSTYSYENIDYTIVEVAGSTAFYKALNTISIPASVRKVEWPSITKYCNEVIIAPENEYFTARDNAVYSKDMTELISITGGNTVKSLTVPAEVRYILSSACSNTTLESVTLNEGLIGIGSSAFAMTNIRSVRLPETLKYLGDGAFSLSPVFDENGNFISAAPEYGIEILNIPESLIYCNDLCSMPSTQYVYKGETLRFNPANVHSTLDWIEPRNYPDLKSIYCPTLSYFNPWTPLAGRYAEAGKESPVVHTTDEVIAKINNYYEEYEKDLGKPYPNKTPLKSIGKFPEHKPEMKPENTEHLPITIPVYHNEETNEWYKTRVGGIAGYYLQLQNDTIDTRGWGYDEIKFVESTDNPGKYYIQIHNNFFAGQVMEWTPYHDLSLPVRQNTQYYANPALFELIEHEDGTVRIVDEQGVDFLPENPEAHYHLLSGNENIARYNSNHKLLQEFNKTLCDINSLIETGIIQTNALVYSADHVRSDFSEPLEGNLESLFDSDYDTFWHSVWSTATSEPYHSLEMIFADNLKAKDLSLYYASRFQGDSPQQSTKISEARIYWSNDGGATFSDEYITLDSEHDGLGQGEATVYFSLPEHANAIRFAAKNYSHNYWALSELRLNEFRIISDQTKADLKEYLDGIDSNPLTGNFGSTISSLQTIMEEIKSTGAFTQDGLREIEREKAETETSVEWYDLHGRRISHPSSGNIYIRRSNITTRKVRM